jgi:hypothetical protein
MSRRVVVILAALALAALYFASTATADPPVLDPGAQGPVTIEATGPSGATFSWPAITATDPEQGTLTLACTPGSGTTFPLGPPTTVDCSATDDESNPVNHSFTVTVQDTTDPVLIGVPGPQNVTVGDTVTYISPTATDTVDPSPTVGCTPDSGFTASVTVDVVCTATDDSGNSAQQSFTVEVNEPPNTPPVLSLPGPIVVQGTGPTVVTYSASASDAEDNPDPTPSCSPPSGSSFPFGVTTVSCSVTDTDGASDSGTFSVTVQDPGSPVVNVPADITVEANGPTGSVVDFANPASASDNKDGALLAPCSRGPGLFALGTTTVTCSVTDSDGHVGSASFTVTVRDTTDPTLIVPGSLIVESATPIGPGTTVITSWLSFVSASDLVDTNVTVTNNTPVSIPIGTTAVTFTATDDSGNSTSITRTITVVDSLQSGAVSPNSPIPSSLQPDVPPADVSSAKGVLRGLVVLLSWKLPSDPDLERIEIMRTPGRGKAEQSVVYKGKGTSFRDQNVGVGRQYRYLILAYDKKGNHGVGVPVVVTVKLNLLLAPGDGAKVKRAPLLKWRKTARATYYNVQVYRGKQKGRRGATRERRFGCARAATTGGSSPASARRLQRSMGRRSGTPGSV